MSEDDSGLYSSALPQQPACDVTNSALWHFSTVLYALMHIVAGLQKHAELLESYGRREAAAADYVRAVRPGLEVHTGELHDAKVRLRWLAECLI